MCARCEQLEERVAFLESELGLRQNDEAVSVLHRAIRGTRRCGGGALQAARMVSVLYGARGMVRRDTILDAVPPAHGGDDERLPKIIDVWLCRARKALGHDAIETVWGHGLKLTDAGRARVDAILAGAA